MRSSTRNRQRMLSVLASLLVIAFLSLCPQRARAAPAADYGQPVAGQRIYDHAGTLTPSEVANLETHAATVAQAGAPTVVYLQARDATYEETLKDAADLMQAWNIESTSGAKDGFVMFVNLQPGNLRHGQVALYAGAKHFNGGNLPQSELERIYADEMLPLLKNGQTADGIAAGLDAVAHDLQTSPPQTGGNSPGGPNSPDQYTPAPQGDPTAASFARLPLNLLALAFVGLLFWLRRRLRYPRSIDVSLSTPTTAPEDLAPAVVGALVRGKVDDAQMEATVLDLARRGALAIESDATGALQLRLLDEHVARPGYEQRLYHTLEQFAQPDHVIGSSRMPLLRQAWWDAHRALRDELVTRGWYIPDTSRRTLAFVALSVIAFILMIIGALVSSEGQEGWGCLGTLAFLGCSVVAMYFAATPSSVSATGEQLAVHWRQYRSLLTTTDGRDMSDADLDVATPYAVALGVADSLRPRLDRTNAARALPQAIEQATEAETAHPSVMPNMFPWYAYYAMFHSALYPPPPPSTGGYHGGYYGGGFGGGGFGGGGGAAGGGGGGGGSF